MMRKVAILLLCTLTLAACEKKYCWQCDTEERILGVSPQGDSVMQITGQSGIPYCDKTTGDIQELEKAGNSETVSKDGDITVYKSNTMKCAR